MVRLYLPESDTWICRKEGKITDTFVKGMALEVELTDGIKDILEQHEGMVTAVPCSSEIKSTLEV